MPDEPRLEQLRRRVRADPTSIAFAALAEEYRRSGRYLEAIETCRVGLQRHPAYLSARVTLGRALIGVGDYDAARLELEAVLRAAPENLAAIRAMAEIYSHLRESEELQIEAPIPDQIEEATRIETSPEPEPQRHHAAITRLERFLEGIVRARAQIAATPRD